MGFLGPLYLIGAAGVIVPVLIHLFGRRRPRRVRFPSLMFLQAAQQRRRSPLRVRRIISLLMRMAAIILLAMALAGPLTRSGLLTRIASDGQVHAIIIDASASMSALSGDVSASERAVVAARGVIEALPAGARVLLATAGAELRLAGDGEPLSHAEALAALTDLMPTEERGRLPDVVARGLDLIAEADGAGSLFVITDLQATAFDDAAHVVDQPSTDVVLIDAGAQVGGNVGLTDVTVTGPAIKGRPLTFSVRVDAWGEVEPERVPLSVEGIGETVSVGVTPVSGVPAWAEVHMTPDRSGVCSVSFSLPRDAMPLDDRLTASVLVRDRLRVLVVGDESPTRYVRAALDPYGDDERTVIAVDLTSPTALADADLSRYDVVAVCDAPLLPKSSVDALAAEMADGLGVLVFMGPAAAANDYATRVFPALGLEGLAPGAVTAWPDGVALTVTENTAGPLATFLDPSAGDLGTARFTAARELLVPAHLRSAIRSRYEEGTAAIVEGASGRGRSALLNMAPDDAWSDFTLEPTWVPFVHQLVYYLAAGRNALVMAGAPGEAVVGTLPDGVTEAAVSSVDGAREEPLPVENGVWRYTPHRAGAWRVSVDGEDICAFAVNLDRAEMDPARLEASRVRELLGPARVTVIAGGDAGRLASQLATPPTEVSAVFALLALLLLACEAVYSLERQPAADDSAAASEA